MVRMSQKGRWATLWLIVGGEAKGSMAKPLAVGLPGDKEGALAIFSFEEEAQMYLQVEAPEGSWRVEEVEAEELASMLLWGSCSQFRLLALDPMPPQSVIREANHLICASRQCFLDLLIGKSEHAAIVGS